MPSASCWLFRIGVTVRKKKGEREEEDQYHVGKIMFRKIFVAVVVLFNKSISLPIDWRFVRNAQASIESPKCGLEPKIMRLIGRTLFFGSRTRRFRKFADT